MLVAPDFFGDAFTVASHHATPLSIELFHASGALVVNVSNPQPVSMLQTAGLVAGVYHLRVTFVNGVVVKRVVKE